MIRLPLTALSREAIIDEARRYAAQLLPEWEFDSLTDIGRLALDIYLAAIEQRTAVFNGWMQEGFLSSCRLRSSAVAIATALGYRPSNAQPSIGTVSLVFSDSATSRTYQPYSIQVSNANAVPAAPTVFENSGSFTVPAHTTVVAVPFVAGASQFDTLTGTGRPDQQITLTVSGVIDASVAITDSLGNSWTEQVDLVSSAATSRDYVTRTNYDGTTQVLFGDGSNGLSPGAGLTLTIRYRVGGGMSTNINTVGSVLTVVSGDALSCSNTTAFTGGADPESLASIKRNAPAAVRRRDTLARVEEVIGFSESYPGIARAYAQLFGNSVVVYAVPEGGGIASPELKAALQSAINSKIIMGCFAQVGDPVYLPVSISVRFTTKEGYDSAQVEASMALLIKDRVSPLSTKEVNGASVFRREFGEPLRVNSVRAWVQTFADAGVILEDYEVLAPTSDIIVASEVLLTDAGATLDCVSRNVTTIVYRG